MTEGPVTRTVTLAEFFPTNLGAPFEVVLKDSVKQIVIDDTGEVIETLIPNPRGLLHKIALTRLIYPRKMSGQEIRFVRRSLSVKAKHLADMIGVTPEHLSRCEHGDRVLSVGAEKCLRIGLLLDHLTISYDEEKAFQQNEELKQAIGGFKDALGKLKLIISEMSIPSAHDAKEILSLAFRVIRKGDTDDLFETPDEEDWKEEELAEAA